jgi:flavin-dependent dehydrogenase
MYDVAVIGAGPAGATLLGQLSLGLPGRVLVEPQLFVVRAIDAPTGLSRFYQRHYVNIGRAAFERWMLSLLPAGVRRCLGWELTALERDRRAFTVRLRRSAGGKEITERARVVVGADGARSKVRRLIGARPARRSYVAVQDWFEAPAARPHFAAIFDPDVTDFYSWAIPKRGLLIVGAALPPGAGAAARLDRLIAALPGLGFRLGRRVRREAAPLLRPAGPGAVCLGAERTLLIGEAAGWISPSSGEGISYAFRSALAAAEALSAGPAGALGRYRTRTRALRQGLAAKVLKGRLLGSGLVRRAVMCSGLRAVPVGDTPERQRRRGMLVVRPGDVL